MSLQIMGKKKYFINFGIGFFLGIIISIYLFSFRTADLYWYASLPLGVLSKWIGYQCISFLESGVITGLLLASFLAIRRGVLDKDKKWYKQFFFDVPLLVLYLCVSWLQVNYLNPVAMKGMFPVVTAARMNGTYEEIVKDEYYTDAQTFLKEYPSCFTTPVLEKRINTFQQEISKARAKSDSILSVLPDTLADAVYEDNDLQAIGITYHKPAQQVRISSEKCDTLLNELGECIETVQTQSEHLDEYKEKLERRVPRYYFAGFYLVALISGALEGFRVRRRRKKNGGEISGNRFMRLMKNKRFAIPVCMIGVFVLLFYHRGVQHIVHVEQVPCKFPVVVYGKQDEGRIMRIQFPFTIECRSLSLRAISYGNSGYWSDWEKKWGHAQGTSVMTFVEDCDTLRWLNKEKNNPDLKIHLYPSRQYILQQNYSIRKDSVIQQHFIPYLSKMRELGKDTLHLTYQQMEMVTPGLVDSILSGDTINVGFRYDEKTNSPAIPVKGF